MKGVKMKGLQRIRIYDNSSIEYRPGAEHWLLEDVGSKFFMILSRPEAPRGNSFTSDLKAEIYALSKQLYSYNEVVF